MPSYIIAAFETHMQEVVLFAVAPPSLTAHAEWVTNFSSSFTETTPFLPLVAIGINIRHRDYKQRGEASPIGIPLSSHRGRVVGSTSFNLRFWSTELFF